MWRLLFTISLAVLCAVTCTLWARSYTHGGDGFNLVWHGTRYELHSSDGWLFAGYDCVTRIDSELARRPGGWAPHAVVAVVPIALIAFQFLARRARRAGHCAACGYDLRATPDRCPECGAVAAP